MLQCVRKLLDRHWLRRENRNEQQRRKGTVSPLAQRAVKEGIVMSKNKNQDPVLALLAILFPPLMLLFLLSALVPEPTGSGQRVAKKRQGRNLRHGHQQMARSSSSRRIIFRVNEVDGNASTRGENAGQRMIGNRRSINPGPRCWICGKPNDGHRHE